MFNPLCTAKVWLPRYVASLIISLNQNDIESITDNKPKNTKSCAEKNPCIVSTPDVVSTKRDIEVYIGQGEGDTKWNGWTWKLFLVLNIISHVFITCPYYVLLIIYALIYC